MRLFKTRDFARFARKEGIGDAQLCDAIERAERGLIDADLGGGVCQRRSNFLSAGRSNIPSVLNARRPPRAGAFLRSRHFSAASPGGSSGLARRPRRLDSLSR